MNGKEKEPFRTSSQTYKAIPAIASSATLACCFTKSSLALTFTRAADNFSVKLLMLSLTSSGTAEAFDDTSGDFVQSLGDDALKAS